MKAIVLYYTHDTGEHKAVEVETDIVDSAMPHVYGLDGKNADIIAVIAEPGAGYTVFIEEDAVLYGKDACGGTQDG